MSTAKQPSLDGTSDTPRSYKVFVSSTYLDNRERRKTVQDVVTMTGMVWHGMEIFTAETRPTPEACVRRVQESDLFVGIIAWRYRWEPQAGKSITEIEYDAAKKAGIDRLMFRIDPELPVIPDKDYDPGPDRWEKQKRLDAFIQRFSQDQMPALFTETTLGQKVLHALNLWRAEREPAPPGGRPGRDELSPPAAEPDFDEDIRRYRRKADTLHATLPVAGFVTRLRVPIDIEDIYVPLHAMVDLRGVAEERFADAAHAEELLRKSDAALEISLPEAFRQANLRRERGVVILGDPGSGKTTHLKRLLLWCLRKGPETLDLPEGMLPVFLPLRELHDLEHGLDAFIEDQLDSPHLKMPTGFGRRLLQRGNLLFLLDGLDEVADVSRREQVSRWIGNALRAHGGCRFVVTCRFAGYSPDVGLSEDFLEMHIRPMNADQVARFVRNWYRIVERGLARDPEQAEGIALEKAENLIERLKKPDFRARRVFELTRNPLLLTNICLVHRHRGSLPHKRERLYKECIDVLLEHWHGAIGLAVVSAQQGRRMLQPAAHWLHSKKGRMRATAAELVPHIEPVLNAVNWSGGGAGDFLRIIRDESGLLTGWGADQYGFMHLGFQEYLAAREIRSRAFKDSAGDAGVLHELAGHFGESWWQEVGLLLLALEDPSLFVPYMREVVKQPAFARHPGLVEMCLDDAAETSAEPFVELLETDPGTDSGHWQRQLAALKVLERLDAEVAERLLPKLLQHPFEEIRRRAAEHTDRTRQEVIVLDPAGYELVHIPGGVFQMGSPQSEEGRTDAEGPQHEVRVPAFYMGRYPVTNEQYARFLAENPDATEPDYWADRNFNQSRQPVVGVSWEDARQYAAWTGLRLPGESEWEYACRAGTRTRFYTGDGEADLKRAGWYAENSDGELQSVGGKQPNAFGLYDMHGNVWEWAEDDWHENYKGAPDDESPWVDAPRGTYRVVRGGSWDYDARGCRSANRFNDWPADRYHYLGFRLARSVTLGP